MMIHHRYILLILLLGASLLLLSGWGMGDGAIASGPRGEAKEEVNTKPLTYPAVANKGDSANTAEKKVTQTPTKKEPESETDQETTPKDKKSTSFKDFVPSEKISGDSAVEFPVDI